MEGYSAEEAAHRKQTRHVFYPSSANSGSLLSHSVLSDEGGVTSCFQRGCISLPAPPLPTHTFQHHTRFYSWMKSINGSSERVARQWTQRPGRHANSGFPGLCYKKNLSAPSGCTIKNETLVCTDPPQKTGSMSGNLAIWTSVGVREPVVKRLLASRGQVVCFSLSR